MYSILLQTLQDDSEPLKVVPVANAMVLETQEDAPSSPKGIYAACKTLFFMQTNRGRVIELQCISLETPCIVFLRSYSSAINVPLKNVFEAHL